MGKDRLSNAPVDLILETSSILFFCGAAFSTMTLFRQGVTSPISFIVATSIPAAASLLLLMAALAVPNVYAVSKLVFPLNVTLPLIHGSMVFMLAELTRGSFGLEKPPEPLMPALAWTDLKFLAPAVVAQVIVLTVIIGLKGKPLPNPEADVQR